LNILTRTDMACHAFITAAPLCLICWHSTMPVLKWH